MLDGLLTDLGGIGLPWLCLLAFGLAFSETALFLDLVVPGEVGMVLVGAAVAQAGEPVPAVIACAAVGALGGDSLSYGLGRRFGRRLVHRFELTRRRLEPAVERAEVHFAEHGGRAVFFGRFVGALRAVVPFVAGVAGLSLPRFLAWNVAASVLWTGTVISLGAILGETVADRVDAVSTTLSVVVLVALGAWWWRRRRRRHVGSPP